MTLTSCIFQTGAKQAGQEYSRHKREKEQMKEERIYVGRRNSIGKASEVTGGQVT